MKFLPEDVTGSLPSVEQESFATRLRCPLGVWCAAMHSDMSRTDTAVGRSAKSGTAVEKTYDKRRKGSDVGYRLARVSALSDVVSDVCASLDV